MVMSPPKPTVWGHSLQDILNANAARRRKRGKDFSAWLRRGMVDSRTGEMMPDATLARLIGKRSSYIQVLVNDCYDAHEDRVKLPSEDVIDKIASVLKIDANEGRRAAGRPLKEDAAATGEITRELAYDTIPAPEGFHDLDDTGRTIARETFQATVEALLRARRQGGYGYEAVAGEAKVVPPESDTPETDGSRDDHTAGAD